MEKEYGKSDQSFLRSYNVKKVRCILRDRGPHSRIELSSMSNLDKKTITNIIKEMFDNGEVKVLSKNNQGTGRPKETLSLNGEYCRCIGLDIGGTHISGVVLDFTGKVLCSHNIDLANMSSDIMPALCDLVIEELMKKSKLSLNNISEIGVSFPGHLDSKTGRAILAENLRSWQALPLEDLFMDKYGKRIIVDDCSRLMALAELRYGAGRDGDDLIIFDLGLGIGCGLVINRKIFAGATGMSGEVGHTIVEADGPRCTCGRNGCIESLASGWALTRQAIELLNRNESKMLYEATNKNTSIPTVKEIALAAKLGDEKCRHLLKNAGRYIAIGIINAASIINPSKVVIGGRLIQDNDILFDEIVERVKCDSIPELVRDMKIEASPLGGMASAIGAATICFEKYFV